jgi:hypothetical protein
MMVSVTKPDSAVRQLNVAIDLLFANADPLCVRTLAAAAHTVLSDLVDKTRAGASWRNRILEDSGLARKEAIRVLNQASNFLKHAERDGEMILEFAEEENDRLILVATLECAELGHPLSIEMKAFQVWFFACNPLVLGGRPNAIGRKSQLILPGLDKLDRRAKLRAGSEFLPVARARFAELE